MQRAMKLCAKCYQLVKDGYDVKVIKPMSNAGKCDYCGYPKMYGYEVLVSGKGSDKERDHSYPSTVLSEV